MAMLPPYKGKLFFSVAIATFYRSGRPIPVQVFLMTPDAISMKGLQQRHRDILVGHLFVASGTLASFAVVPVGMYPEIMMADQAMEDVFM